MLSKEENPVLVVSATKAKSSIERSVTASQVNISNNNAVVKIEPGFRTQKGTKPITKKGSEKSCSNRDGFIEPLVLNGSRMQQRRSVSMKLRRRNSLPSAVDHPPSAPSSNNSKALPATTPLMKARRSNSLTCLETSTSTRSSANQSKDNTSRSRSSKSFSSTTTTKTFEKREIWAYASKHAYRTVEKITSYSRFLDRKMMDSLPKFKRQEIILGDLLGSGGFNDVYAVHEIKLEDPFSFDYSPQEQAVRASMALKAHTNTGGRPKSYGKSEIAKKGPYAIKFLNKQCMEHPEKFCRGAADLMIETAYLSSLYPHPNIISLHGVAAASYRGFSSGLEGGYFLLLDRLAETLEDRVQTWKRASSSLSANSEATTQKRRYSIPGPSRIGSIFAGIGAAPKPPSQQDSSESQRLEVTLKICSALAHLHKFNVIFRDLKPDNVGFDFRGNVKLFDFGLVKELENAARRRSNDLDQMSGGAIGSRRYMAPEVVLGKPYGLSADVYSFSILLWRVRTLLEPFDGYTRAMHYDRVVQQNERPTLDATWSHVLSHITKCSWNTDPKFRPSSQALYTALQREVKLTMEREYEIGQIKKRMSC